MPALALIGGRHATGASQPPTDDAAVNARIPLVPPDRDPGVRAVALIALAACRPDAGPAPESGTVWGCAFIGDLYRHGRGGMRPNLGVACESYRQACDLGLGQGCGSVDRYCD